LDRSSDFYKKTKEHLLNHVRKHHKEWIDVVLQCLGSHVIYRDRKDYIRIDFDLRKLAKEKVGKIVDSAIRETKEPHGAAVKDDVVYRLIIEALESIKIV